MQVLVIGGTRFIGPHVVRQLVSAGQTVTVFHRGQNNAELPSSVEHILGDRSKLSLFSTTFRRLAPDVVLDTIPFSEQDARTLVETFRGIAGRVVALSSGDVYLTYDRLRRISPGSPSMAPITEEAPLREVLFPYRAQAPGPEHWLYHYDKILVEQVVLNDSALPGTVLRLPAVYGPGDYFHRLHEYLKRMDDGRPAILVDEQQAKWRWTRGYVENVAAAIALAVTDARAVGRTYNVGEPDALSEAEWICHIGQAAGWEGEIIPVPYDRLPAHLAGEGFNWRHHWVTDTSRLREELGYAEPVSREEALRRSIEWERAHPPAEIDPAQFDYQAEDMAVQQL